MPAVEIISDGGSTVLLQTVEPRRQTYTSPQAKKFTS